MPELFFDRLKIILQNPLWWILFAIAVFVLWIISTRHKYKKREPSTYSDLIKQYRERYMDAVYRMPECVKEIQERALNNFHIVKTPQEIISDLKQSSTPVSKDTLTNKRRSGGILLVAKMPIHTSLIEICQIFIRNNDIYITNKYYSDCGVLGYKTSNYKRQNVLWNTMDWKHFNYNRYIVSPNTALNLITETIKSIFDHSSECETNAKYITGLNSLLNPYKIHTEMTQKSWNFFFDGTPISLEEAIRKLPDDVLLRQTPSISRNTPTSAQKKPIKPSPTVAKNNLSQKGQPRTSTPAPAQKAPAPPPKAPSKPKPKLSIEEELLNYLKAQPICWEFPLTTQDKALNKFCEALVFSDSVTGVGSNEAIKNLELTIQKKRARNPRLADHNAAMEGNNLCQ